MTIFEPLLVGTPPEELQQEVALFESALDSYFGRRFEVAESILQQLQTSHPHRLYAYYLGRVQNCLKDPPPPEWDGVTVHARK